MKSETQVQAVLFDMDGTLINSEPYWLIAETKLMSRFGHRWTDEDQAFCIGGPLPKVGSYMSELSGSREDAAYFESELIQMVAEQFAFGLPFIPGARELVENLVEAEIPLALVSASPRLLVDCALALLPNQTFLTSVSNQDVRVSKPDPESYLLAASHLSVDIGSCLVLEDSKTGIDAGLASGAVVIGIPHIITYPPTPRLHLRRDLLGLTIMDLEVIYLEASRKGPHATGI
jgi:HAD superfamily hydrolase (TIGR01509 family)